VYVYSNSSISKKINYRNYPRIGRTFFKGKNGRNLGCGLYAGPRVFSSLIRTISRHKHVVNKVTECLTVWLNVSYEVKLIHVFEEFCSSPLQRVYLVSEYVCYWMKSKEVCMSSREALLMPFTWNCVCLFAELHEKYTAPIIKRKSHKWNWYKISQFRSLIHTGMSSVINKRWFIFTLCTILCIRQKRNLKPLNTQWVTQWCFCNDAFAMMLLLSLSTDVLSSCFTCKWVNS